MVQKRYTITKAVQKRYKNGTKAVQKQYKTVQKLYISTKAVQKLFKKIQKDTKGIKNQYKNGT